MQFQTQKYHLSRLRAFEKIDFILVTETYTSCFSKEASLWIHEDTSFMSCSSLSPQLEQRTHPSLRAQTLHYSAVYITAQRWERSLYLVKQTQQTRHHNQMSRTYKWVDDTGLVFSNISPIIFLFQVGIEWVLEMSFQNATNRTYRKIPKEHLCSLCCMKS